MPHSDNAGAALRWRYNPFEIAFEEGGPAAFERVLPLLARGHTVGCVEEGSAGCRIAIHDATGLVAEYRGAVDPVARLLLLDADFALVTGAAPGRDGTGEARISTLDLSRLASRPAEELADLVIARLRERTAPPLRGLVLAGGESRRMGRDKAALVYHGRPQTEHLLELLGRFCAGVHVSSRPDQAASEGRRGLPQIHDRFSGFGPSGGILSALHHDPSAAWLVVACDLPLIDERVIGDLTAQRDPFCAATCYRGGDGMPEPMCAIYEPKFRLRLHHDFAEGSVCPRGALAASRIRMLDPRDPASLENVNEPGQYRRVLAAGGKR
jgi:molybdopterin-guanine dinucleotide biosynthesis protein A